MERLAKIRTNANNNLLTIKVVMESLEYSKMNNDEFLDSLRELMKEVERNYKIIEQIDAEINYLVEWCEENG